MVNEHQFKIGDWVTGKTRETALIQGFIVGVNFSHGVIKICVVESDQRKLIGKTIRMLHTWAQKLPVSSRISEKQMLQLIDLALLTKDEKWFEELSAGFNSLRKSTQPNQPADPCLSGNLKNSETKKNNR